MGKPLKKKDIVFTLVMWILAILMIYPFIMMVAISFRPSGQAYMSLFASGILYTLRNYKEVLFHPNFFDWYRNTIVTVAVTIIIRLCITIMAAYAFSRLRFRGKAAILAFLVAVAIEKDAVMATKAIEAGGSRQLIDAAEGVAVSSDDVFVAVANDVELDDAVIILGFGHAFQTKGLQTTPDVVIGKDDDIGDGIDADGDGRVEEGLLDRDDLIVETLRILDSEFLASSLDGLFFSLSFELVHISPPKWFV